MKNKNSKVLKAVAEYAVEKYPGIPAEVLDRLAGNENTDVRRNVRTIRRAKGQSNRAFRRFVQHRGMTALTSMGKEVALGADKHVHLRRSQYR